MSFSLQSLHLVRTNLFGGCLALMAKSSHMRSVFGPLLQPGLALEVRLTSCHRLLTYPFLYHAHPKEGLIEAYLDLLLGWGWYPRGYLRVP